MKPYPDAPRPPRNPNRAERRADPELRDAEAALRRTRKDTIDAQRSLTHRTGDAEPRPPALTVNGVTYVPLSAALDLLRTLEACWKTDKTVYAYRSDQGATTMDIHDRDGREPGAGKRWTTPREIAQSAIARWRVQFPHTFMGADRADVEPPTTENPDG